MAKNKYVQFASNTKKYEEDSFVKGSNGIYYFSFTTGTNRDLRQEFLDYIQKKLGGQPMNSNEQKNIGESYFGFFKREDNETYEEFIEAIEEGKRGPIGQTYAIPTGRDYTQVDMNGNILVATINSNLENYQDCGNMLIDGMTGKVIRAPRPSVIINSVDERSGFYPIEIYRSEENKETGNKDIVAREYNFLSPDGKIVNSEFNFSKAPYGEEVIYKCPRNYYQKDGKYVVNDWNIYPMAYVYCTGRDIMFFESARDLLIENRRLKKLNQKPLIDDETIYLKEFYQRKNELDKIIEKLGKNVDDSEISQTIYENIMKIMGDEYDKIDEFESKYETETDKVIEQKVIDELEQVQ